VNRRLNSILSRVTFCVVAVCAMLCCCQVRAILHGCGHEARGSAAAACCGGGCGGDRGEGRPSDERNPCDDGGGGGCDLCCIKWVTPKAAAVFAPSVFAQPHACADMITVVAAWVPAPPRTGERSAVPPGAPTLLRLHCALIV